MLICGEILVHREESAIVPEGDIIMDLERNSMMIMSKL